MSGATSRFLAELKRRKVYQVAATYVAVGLAICVGAPDLFSAFDLPGSAARLVVALAIIGFPFAVVLAWAYEVRPEEAQPPPSEEVEPQVRSGPASLPSNISAFSNDPRPSVAVLPFASFSDNPDTDYFGLGVMEDILTRLAHVRGIRVISRTSVMRYRTGEKSTREIAKELGVQTVVEGSVRQSGGRVRIVAQLIDGTTDEHLWADSYDRDLKDVFRVQTEVAESIAVARRAAQSGGERESVRRITTENQAAWDLYVRALQTVQELAPKGIAEAEANLLEAIDLDSDLAQAWAMLAQVRVLAVLCANERPSEFWPKIREAASRALELNAQCGEGRTALGLLKLLYEWDPQGAEEELDRAHRFNPDDAFALSWKAVLLSFTGRTTEALAIARQGVALEPLWAMTHWVLGQVLIYVDRPEEAAQVLEAAVRTWPNSPVLHHWLGLAYAYCTDWDQAMPHMVAAADASGHLPLYEAFRITVLARSGRVDQAQAALSDLRARSQREYVDPFASFAATLPVDGMDAAVPYLEEALAMRSFFLPYWLAVPIYRPLLADPRFRAARDQVFPGVTFEAEHEAATASQTGGSV
jgi:adenylate cyclase